MPENRQTNLPPEKESRFRDAQQKAWNALQNEDVRMLDGRRDNVRGVGLGVKVRGNDRTAAAESEPEPHLRFYVAKKIPKGELSKEAQEKAPWFVDVQFDGVPTDVIEVKRVRAFGSGLRPGAAISFDDASIPIVNGGTLGALVDDAGNPGLITCNHVIAWNGRVHENAYITDLSFSGADSPVVARLAHYVELRHDKVNTVDCALARLIPDVQTSRRFNAAQRPTVEPGVALLGDYVSKDGQATGVTEGRIVDINAVITVDYDFGTFTLTGQLAIEGTKGAFAADGDSGAIVFREGKQQTPLAMVWGGRGSIVYASPLKNCLDELKRELNREIRIVVEDYSDPNQQPPTSQTAG